MARWAYRLGQVEQRRQRPGRQGAVWTKGPGVVREGGLTGGHGALGGWGWWVAQVSVARGLPGPAGGAPAMEQVGQGQGCPWCNQRLMISVTTWLVPGFRKPASTVGKGLEGDRGPGCRTATLTHKGCVQTLHVHMVHQAQDSAQGLSPPEPCRWPSRSRSFSAPQTPTPEQSLLGPGAHPGGRGHAFCLWLCCSGLHVESRARGRGVWLPREPGFPVAVGTPASFLAWPTGWWQTACLSTCRLGHGLFGVDRAFTSAGCIPGSWPGRGQLWALPAVQDAQVPQLLSTSTPAGVGGDPPWTDLPVGWAGTGG